MVSQPWNSIQIAMQKEAMKIGGGLRGYTSKIWPTMWYIAVPTPSGSRSMAMDFPWNPWNPLSPWPGVGLSQDGLIELQATATYIIDQWGEPRATCLLLGGDWNVFGDWNMNVIQCYPYIYIYPYIGKNNPN